MAATSSIVMGIVTTLLAILFIAGDFLFATSHEAKGIIGHIVIVAIPVFFIALPLHFFLGHRIRWILPALLAMLGMVFIWAGVVGLNLVLLAAGGTSVLVGFGWNASSTSSNPVVRWIASTKEFLTQGASKKP
jgi:hypothetical protein